MEISPHHLMLSRRNKDFNCTYRIVNRREKFVNSQTEVLTQNIKRLWRDIWGEISRYGTRNYHYYIHYSTEFAFERKYQYHENISKSFEIMLYPIEDKYWYNGKWINEIINYYNVNKYLYVFYTFGRGSCETFINLCVSFL